MQVLGRRSISGIAAAAALVVFGISSKAGAQVTGFGGSSATGWSLNGGMDSVSGNGDANDVLTLTPNTGGVASSAWYTTVQSVNNFSVNFTYQPTYTSTPADGITFAVQNSGVSALGGTGGALGYSGINSSAAFEINIYSGASGGPGLAVGTSATNAAIPGTYPVSPVALPTSGDVYNVTLGYDGTTLFSTITDTTAGTGPVSFNSPVNIPSAVGATTALIGFTGGTGGLSAQQTVTNFHFTPGSFVAPTATFLPIGVTGFNQAMVLPASVGSGASSTTMLAAVSATVDGGTGKGGNTFYEQGFNSAAPLSGVPVGGQVFTSQSDSTHKFVMQPATGNDAVMLDSANTTGMLSITSPASYSKLSFLVQDGNGGANFNVTVNFANGAPSETHSVSAPDWFGGSPIAWLSNGRWNPTNGSGGVDSVNSQNPRLYEEDLSLSDTIDPISSLSFTWEASGTTRTDIFGVSGVSSVPEPTSLGLLSLATLGLLRRKRRA